MPDVYLPVARWQRWVENFERGHGATSYSVAAGVLSGRAEDGSRFEARLPFDRDYDTAADPAAFVAPLALPEDWGILLVRKGGFAVARVAGERIVASKVGQRHVQGRTKAGGQSQQRFARRRDNQARQAYEAAADHAARILAGHERRLWPLVTGGDRAAVEEVLADRRLSGFQVATRWLAVPDPRRGVLEQAVRDATAISVSVVNASAAPPMK
ncbi:acVLRF1 family peptidyl-tRNA hydrolase [Nocardioides sp. GXZ039]|uniref:acVLRF1 family peptidyl-tRNA hydrolase n=1 Tax=Nocardioides sp. GXZ039 TaxID=3136018 RepID=UPI0030F49EA1